MISTDRPRRSVLYMPGSNARALEKGRTLPADALILDLEDAVAPDVKETARQQVVDSVKAGGYGGREIVIRINALDSPWGPADLAAAATCPADAILLPKVENAAMVDELESLMNKHGTADDMAIWCMMETPLGMLHAAEIASSSDRIACLVLGTSDLAKDLHAYHTRDRLPMLTSLGLCLLAARAHGRSVVDGVHLDLNDDEGFAYSCRRGRELGFDGKTLIHPKTIALTNEVFAPSAAEVDFSRKIIAAHAAAVAEGKGILVVDGKLIENLHVENARRLVSLAATIETLTADAAE